MHRWDADRHDALLVIVHGYAEHGQRYAHFASYLTQFGIDVRSYDLRGHGMSGGIRAYVDRFTKFVDDLKHVIKFVSEGRRVFLMGHSMGGLVVTRYCQEYGTDGLTGVVLSGPALKLDDDISPLLLKIIPLLSKLFPKLPTEKLEKKYLSRDQEVVEKYSNDPLVYLGGMRARMAAEMISTIDASNASFQKISCPLLVIHGGADKLTNPKGSMKMYEQVSSSDKQIEIIAGAYHELINEPEKEKVMELIKDWITERCR